MAEFTGDPVADLSAAKVQTVQRQISFVQADTVKPRPMRWLWEDRIPLGALTMFMGEEGLGKTTASVALAAKVTRGTLAGELHGQPARVLFASAEDARDTTLVPRLIAAGADLALVSFVDVKVGERDDGLVIPRDVPLLEVAVVEQGVRLVVMDPVVAFLDAQTDSHRDKDTRVAMGPLAAAAERGGFAVLGVIHPNKANTTSERARMMGSVAFRAAARSTLVFGLDPDDPRGAKGSSRVLAPSKNNNAPTSAAHRVKIESAAVASDEGDIRTSRAVFGETCDHTAADVLGAESVHAKRRQQTSAESLLETLLPMRVSDLRELADSYGIGWRTFERAKKSLKIKSKRDGATNDYWWHLSDDERPAI